MRCALVSPGPPEYSQLKKRKPLIHYGLGILASTLKNSGYEVDYIDCIAEKLDLERFKERIARYKPLIVGFTATTHQVQDAGLLAAAVKEVDSSIYTVLGGVHASALPVETMMEFPEIDFILHGEGIIAFPELVSALLNKKPLASIKGIAIRENNRVKINPPREFVEHLDEFPFPAYELLNLKEYSTYSFYFARTFELPLYLGIGCPYPCKYCFRISGKGIRYRSPERTLEEIEMGIKRYGCRYFAFFDDTFGIERKRYYHLLELLIRREYEKRISWTAMSRVDIVDKELLMMMKRAGCSLIYYGVESGSERVLDIIGKNIKREQIINAFKLTRDIGLKAGASIMLGLPGEKREDVRLTSELINLIKPDILDLSVFQPYPGSKFYEEAIADKISVKLKSLNWRYFHRTTSRNLRYENFEEGEIDRIKWKLLAKFYTRPSKLIFGQRYIYGIHLFLAGYILNILYWKIYRWIKDRVWRVKNLSKSI